MEKYNIVVINPDQMRSDYQTLAGHPFINTRHMTRLGEMGTYFSRTYTSCPMCGPARTSMITGQYPSEHQVRNYGGTMSEDYPNMLSELKEQGYRLGLFGKDHIISRDAIGVLYDEGEDICIGNMDKHDAYTKSWSSGTLEKGSQFDLTERLTDSCLSFIEKQHQNDQPFFATINMQDPHPYFAAPAPYDTMFDPEQFELPANFRREPVEGEPNVLSNWRIHSESLEASEQDFKKAMAMYCGQIRYVDDQVGRVIDKLEELNILEKTIIVFWSDHGEFLGDYGVTHKGAMYYDSLTRIPMMIFDPSGKLPKGKVDSLTEVVDIMPTVLGILGLETPAYVRGRNMVSPDFKPRETAFAEGGLYAQQPQQPLHPNYVIKAPFDPTHWGVGAMIRSDRF